jgi:hypothetical protein
MATYDQLAAFLRSPEFTDAEKFVARCQLPDLAHPGNWERKLWAVLCAADELNLEKLARGYPAEAGAFREWSRGNLGERMRAAGLPI